MGKPLFKYVGEPSAFGPRKPEIMGSGLYFRLAHLAEGMLEPARPFILSDASGAGPALGSLAGMLLKSLIHAVGQREFKTNGNLADFSHLRLLVS
jgi:hypothetical protein